VKVLKPDDCDLEKEFFQMAGVLAELSGGPNIINLLGVCLTSHPYCLVLEYASAGDLHRFLRDAAPDHFIERWRRSGSHRSSYGGGRNTSYRLSVVQLVDICRQIAVGMSYVAEHGYVHRDLAARNCLVSCHPTSHRIDVKIADFVLARRVLSGSTYYEGTDSEEIAIRWAAIEAILEARFSEATDVWSFGVTMWEVFSYAARPYGDIDSTPDVVRRVVAGRLLDRPDETPDCVYELMSSCWALDFSKRPSFAGLVTSLGTIKQRLKH
jgi:serine/threonine protein kinase